MRSSPKIILGGRLQSDRSIAVVKGEQSSLRQEREPQRFDPSGYRSTLGPAPFNPGRRSTGNCIRPLRKAPDRSAVDAFLPHRGKRLARHSPHAGTWRSET